MSDRARIYYISAQNERFDLMAEPLRIKKANFHNYVWKAKTRQNGNYGMKVSSFQRQALAYKTNLYITGSKEERKELIDRMHLAFDRDVVDMTPGKLYWEDYCIDCFVDASSTYPAADNSATINEVEFFCPYGFWVHERNYHLDVENISEEGLDYEYDYAYDYTPMGGAGTKIINNSPKPATLLAKIYGPVSNPYFYIADHLYKVNTSCNEGEYIELDTKARTIYRVGLTGTRTNIFNYRNKSGDSTFGLVPSGTNGFLWPGTYTLDLTINEERSEPAWT
jgi:hypothetical protein